MEVGDALGRIHHGQFWTVFVAGVQVAHDFVTLRFRQGLDLVEQIHHTVVDVNAQLFEQFAVFFEGFFVIDLDAVTKHDRVRDLHHGGLHVQREQNTGFTAVFHFLFVELAQCLLTHEHRVDDFAGFEGHFLFQNRSFAAFGDEFHTNIARLVQRHRLFAVIEVTAMHVRNM